VFVAFGIQRAMRMRRIVICGRSGSTVFFHVVSKIYDFFLKKDVIEREMHVLIFFTNLF